MLKKRVVVENDIKGRLEAARFSHSQVLHTTICHHRPTPMNLFKIVAFHPTTLVTRGHILASKIPVFYLVYFFFLSQRGKTTTYAYIYK